MYYRFLFLAVVLFVWLLIYPDLSYGQEIKNVPLAFDLLSSEPEVILVENDIQVPLEKGHLQGIQLIEKNGIEKLLISGSSLSVAYLLQVDLMSRRADRIISLMQSPFRHAGGLQVSGPYVAVGIEDNFVKTTAKVCIYNYDTERLYNTEASLVINREGEAKRYTAGTTGMLNLKNKYLVAISNWDSRNWDFYNIDPERDKQELLFRFDAPDDWAGYQSINLIMDEEAIYAIGTYQKKVKGCADLILISKRGDFKPVMEHIQTKTFHCKEGVDFSSAAGIQVDKKGELHIWGTQRDATNQIVINRFSQH